MAVSNATARIVAEMKPYDEVIAGTPVKFTMVPIPEGTFLMGSPADEPGRAASEGPQRKVALDAFWMGKCEVTWNEFEQWMYAWKPETMDDLRDPVRRKALPLAKQLGLDAVSNPTDVWVEMSFGMGKDGFPAISMTQLAAKLYCKWLSAKTGRYYRLPTEAEWEYACRAGTTTAYSFGDDARELVDYAWFTMNSDFRYHRVGTKKPNPWGLHDMHGNVAEWVLDPFSADGYGKTTSRLVRNPVVVPTALHPRVVRGGSWDDDAWELRSAAQRGSDAAWQAQDIFETKNLAWLPDAYFVGFRVVRPFHLPSAKEAEKYDLDEVQRAAVERYRQARERVWDSISKSFKPASP